MVKEREGRWEEGGSAYGAIYNIRLLGYIWD
jgi:hypothetical protein